VEVHSRSGVPQSWGGLIAGLQRAGFRCYVRPIRAPWRPFVEMPAESCGMDDQFNVFALRAGPVDPPV